MMTVHILTGHVLDRLADLPDGSVHCVVTSVPYWGLRAYGTEPQVWGAVNGCRHEWGEGLRHSGGAGRQGDSSARTGRANVEAQEKQRDAGNFCTLCGAWRGEHGLEPTFDLWLAHEVAIWREIRRVLRDDGTAWLNIGDCYASTANGRPADQVENDDRTFRDKPFSTVGPVYDPGGGARGGGYRGDNKGNSGATPHGRVVEGGYFKPKDRVLMPHRLAIALHADGWWLRDEIVWHKPNPMPSSVKDRTTPAHEFIFLLTKKGRYFFDGEAIKEPVAVEGWDDGSRVYGGVNKHGANAQHGERTTGRTAGYKKPDNWATHDGGHGSFHRDGREKGQPNATEARQTRNKRSVWTVPLAPFPDAHFATFPPALIEPCIKAGCPITGTVLDPFGGSGTTGLVADRLSRNAILIELNPEYAEMARRRIEGDATLLTRVVTA